LPLVIQSGAGRSFSIAHFRGITIGFGFDEAFDRLIKYVDERWGTGESLPSYAPSKADDPALRQWWGKFERLGASPSAVIALLRMNREIDISGILHSINVPTLVLQMTDDALVSVEGGRELAAGIPGARLVEIPGTDHLPFLELVTGYSRRRRSS
jgi:pimeloyl-ACP methyl ester carboxylesterase